MLDFYVKTGIRFSLRDKRLFEITEVEVTSVDCISIEILQHIILEKKLILLWSDTSNYCRIRLWEWENDKERPTAIVAAEPKI